MKKNDSIWATSWETCFMLYANIKDADQSVQMHSLITIFVILFLESIIPTVAISKISRL